MVDVEDSRGFASCLIRLANDCDLRDKLSANARYSIVQFSLDLHAKSIVNIYHEILDQMRVSEALV